MKLRQWCILGLVMALVISMFGAVVPTAVADTTTTLLAGGDFQHSSGANAAKSLTKLIVNKIQASGVTAADGLLFCGDYDYHAYGDVNASQTGVKALKEAVSGLVTENLVLVQGNHDSAIGTAGMSPSGNNDPSSGAYGVFVINEDDYMWKGTSEATVKRTAQNLIDYLNEKISVGYDRPIFVVAHLALHYSMRTRLDGDGKWAKYIFDVLNEAGEKGLNIVYMYGHNHSNGWDDYLGGAAVYLKKGDEILIAQNSQTVFATETLNFTYMNPGYVGYYGNVNGADDTLTMSVIEIGADEVAITRYSKDGVHNLKSAGRTNSYKGESGYLPNTTVYTSPQTIALTDVTDNTLLENLIEPIQGEGRAYRRVTSVQELQDGGRYLMVYNASPDRLMLPWVVTKSSGSGNRMGFDLEETDAFGDEAAFGEYADNEWEFHKTDDGWHIGKDAKYITFTDSSDMKIKATLEDDGDLFTIGGTADAFTFTSADGTVLNYNSRGVINGYASEPAAFYLYEFAGYSVTVTNGTAAVDGNTTAFALPGESVTLTAKAPAADKKFDRWLVTAGDVALADTKAATTTFVMPEEAVKVTAFFVDVNVKLVTSIEVAPPTKTVYSDADEAVDPAGGNVTVYYDDNTDEEISLSAEMLTGFDPTTLGTQTITVTYGGCTDTFIVEVQTAALVGDVNADGKVNTTDARRVLQYAADVIGADELDASVSDVDGDKKINTTDARYILRLAAGIIDAFPVQGK